MPSSSAHIQELKNVLLRLPKSFLTLLWQQVLKRMPLTVAFANKAVVIIWGIVWGMLFFGETLRISMVVGSVIIIAGIYLVVSDDE